MDKEKYITPDMEIVEFEAEDIITTRYEDDETKLIKYLLRSISAGSAKLSADAYDREECDMIRMIKTVLLGVLCAVCLYAPLNAGAVELPIVPVEESQSETTTAVSETPAATQNPAEQETPVITEAPATTKATETAKASANDMNTSSNEDTVFEQPASEIPVSEINELPVLSPDGESTVEKSESNSDSSISDDNDSSETQATAQEEIGTRDQNSENNALPIIVAVICGVAALAGAAIFTVFKRGKK